MAATTVTCPNCGKRNRVSAQREGVPRCAVCQTLLPWVVDADDRDFDEEVAAAVPVLVDFWAPWCGPCKWVAPTVDEMAYERAGQLKVVRIDVDKAPATAERYTIRGIPTLMTVRDGDEVDRLTGAVAKPQLNEWLNSHLGRSNPGG